MHKKMYKDIRFPHCDQVKSRKVYYSIYVLNHIIDDHISQNIEIWTRYTRINEFLLRKFTNYSASRPSNYLLYKDLSKLLFAAIKWSAAYPFYVLLSQAVTKSDGKVKSSKEYIFLAKEGFIVFAGSKPSKLHIKTAFFPVEINKYDSNYIVFSRAFRYLKRRNYVNRKIRDSKYGQTREITDCSFVIHNSWKHVPPPEKYNEM